MESTYNTNPHIGDKQETGNNIELYGEAIKDYEDLWSGRISREELDRKYNTERVKDKYEEANKHLFYSVKLKGVRYPRKRTLYLLSNRYCIKIFSLLSPNRNFIILFKLIIMF